MATNKIKATVINLEQEVPKSGGSPWLMISEKAAAAAMSSERPGLVAGSAQSLVGPKVSAGPAVALAAPATGAAILDAIKGRTLVWNQLVNSDTVEVPTISGRKYLTRIGGTSTIITADGTPIAISDAAEDNVFDLTAMFGAGYEPATVAEFEALFPESYYANNTGTLLPLRLSGLVSKDADDAELATLSLPIVGKTAKDSGGNPIVPFPEGMNGDPTVYDVARTADGSKVMGVVDLGDQTWTELTTDTSGKKRFGCELTIPAKYVSASSIPHIICSKYVAGSNEDTYAASLNDKIVATRGNGGLLVLDSAYTDAATFTAAMAGVKLVYELATPVPFTWDEPLEVVAPVAEGGVLELQPEGVDEQGIPATAPLAADIKWPVNAVSADTLTNLLDALKTAGVITAYTMTWDAAAGAYTFTIS